MNFLAFRGSPKTIFSRAWRRRSPVALPESRSKNPRRNAEFEPRKKHFLKYIDPARTRGLEIGPLDLPMIEPHEGDCEFADYHSTDELKQMAAQLSGTDPDFVPHIDYVIAEGYDAVPRDYDWIAAANILEHVADVIGWLRTVGEHLKPGGLLFLALPDRRYTFDTHRHLTTFAELVSWHVARLTKPSFAQVFDFTYYYANDFVYYDIWAGKPAPPPEKNFSKAIEAGRLAEKQYYDVHCSVFTTESFEALAREMIAAGLIPYEFVSIEPPARNTLDFSVILRRV
jgi:SAM-dependent methyltransferase